MLDNLQLNFRKEIIGPENDMVEAFLNHYIQKFEQKNFKFKVLKEVYAETGIPDILIVVWEEMDKWGWSPKRNNLDKTDIKILHHISLNGKRGIRFKRILEELGYPEKISNKSLKKLVDAELIDFNGTTARIKDFESSFFVREIISIEAKISDWKNAFRQAQLNENFSSHSYVLLPDEAINENVLASSNGNLGILSQSKNGAKLKVRAKKSKLPGSYFSWLINEYIGRQLASTL
ncbi:MAG: hypothetical protein JJ876_11650 [Muricauda sp.]|nr:hypothetical protein [Allomuricauda sp.]MBO6830200.1 hypothetical protein [Allomuricauda sp.]